MFRSAARRAGVVTKHVEQPGGTWTPTSGETVDSPGSARAFVVAEMGNVNRATTQLRVGKKNTAGRTLAEAAGRLRQVAEKLKAMAPAGSNAAHALGLVDRKLAAGEYAGRVSSEANIRTGASQVHDAARLMMAAANEIEEKK